MPEYFLDAAIWLQFEEGLRVKPYKCTADRWTIGYGRNLQDNGISQQEAELLACWDTSRGHHIVKLYRFHPLPIKIGDDWIIGYGHNLTQYGVSREIAEILLLNDMQTARDWLERFAWWEELTHNRKCAVLNMGFQLGETRFKGFRKTIDFLSKRLYTHAAEEALNSHWAKQTSARAHRVAGCIKTDVLPEIVRKRLREMVTT